MKEIVCTGGFIALVDAEWFEECSRFKWFVCERGYVKTYIKGKKHKMQHIVMGADRLPDHDTHHRNKNKLDNRRSNLIQIPRKIHSSLHVRERGTRHAYY